MVAMVVVSQGAVVSENKAAIDSPRTFQNWNTRMAVKNSECKDVRIAVRVLARTIGLWIDPSADVSTRSSNARGKRLQARPEIGLVCRNQITRPDYIHVVVRTSQQSKGASEMFQIGRFSEGGERGTFLYSL
jgi:hypothetical protein